MASPIVGAWARESDNDQGLIIFTESHYSFAFMQKNCKPFQNEDEHTEAEEAEAYRTFQGGSGTYAVSDSVITFNHEESFRDPNWIGRPISRNLKIDGDKMIWTRERDGLTVPFRKVS